MPDAGKNNIVATKSICLKPAPEQGLLAGQHAPGRLLV
jgi:hypothetical protein